jgi:hypothetical protein
VSARIGAWSQTYTGRQYWPQDPRPEDVDPIDIAHALSLQCRFGGHCKWHYSVAQHSLLVAELLGSMPAQGPGTCDWGLLHDASEAYMVDLPRPLKNHSAMGLEYKRIEALNMRAIWARFGLVGPQPEAVAIADEVALAMEFRDVMGLPPDALNLQQAPASPIITRMSPEACEAIFLNTLGVLLEARRDEQAGWSSAHLLALEER